MRNCIRLRDIWIGNRFFRMFADNIENKQKDELQFKQLGEYKTKIKGFGEVKYPFIEYLSYRLRKYGKKSYPFLNVLEEQVNKMVLENGEVKDFELED